MFFQRPSKLDALIKERKAYEKSRFAGHEFKEPYNIPKTDINFCDVYGKSLLHYAIEEGDLDRVKQLVEEEQADYNLTTQTLINTIKPIELALQHGHCDIAKFLYAKGANCYDVPLQSAKTPECHKWFKQVIKENVNTIYTPESFFNVQSVPKNNPFFKSHSEEILLQRAIEIGEIDYLKSYVTWLEKDNDFEPLRKQADTLFKLASENGQLDIVNFFISANLNPDPKEKYSKNALQSALHAGKYQIADILLQAGSDINWQGYYKYTALMLAVNDNNLEQVKYILSKNPDLTKTDIYGENVLHHAVLIAKATVLKENEVIDLTILTNLVEAPGSKALLSNRDIYGKTVLDYVAQSHPAIRELFEKKYKITVTPKVDEDSDIAINQLEAIRKILFYFRSQHRDAALLNLTGCCNGFTYLFHLYSSNGGEDYFFSTLALIASWDGEPASLRIPFNKDMPQVKYYKNLGELLDQWINDIIFFQHAKSLESITRLTPDQRSEQHAIIGDKFEDRPVSLFHTICKLGVLDAHYSYNKAQLQEYLNYFTKMPAGSTRLQLSGGKHATGAYVNAEGKINYYDSNFKSSIATIATVEEFVERVIDTKYIRNHIFPKDGQFPIIFQLFFFEKNRADFSLDNYRLFKYEELPNSTDEALAFQKNNSANQFTHFHVAILTSCLSSLNDLMSNKYCDVNALNRFGESPLMMAIDQDFDEAIQILLKHPDINLSNSLEIVKAYLAGKNEIINLIMNNPRAVNLSNLLSSVIKAGDLKLVKLLVENNKVDINPVGNQYCPLMDAIQYDQMEIIKFLLEQGAKPFVTTASGISPLENIVKKPIYYLIFKPYITDINQVDENGNALTHYLLQNAFESQSTEILHDIIQSKANLYLKNAANKSPLDCFAELCVECDLDQKMVVDIMKEMIGTEQLNSKTANVSWLNQLLSFSIEKGYEQLFNLLMQLATPPIIDYFDPKGLTLLHIATRYKHFEILEALIKAGADINSQARTAQANTCLHIMIQYNYEPKYIELFLKHDASLDSKNGQEKTAREYLNASTNVNFDKFKNKGTSQNRP